MEWKPYSCLDRLLLLLLLLLLLMDPNQVCLGHQLVLQLHLALISFFIPIWHTSVSPISFVAVSSMFQKQSSLEKGIWLI